MAKKDKKHRKNKKNPKKRREPKGPSQASVADRHDLYERAVQDVASDVDFLLEKYREHYGEKAQPLHFREDFCGTAALCAEWVQRGSTMTAEGFDIDPECLEWGVRRNLDPLGDAAGRVTLHREDVRLEGERPADVRCAQNFSYQVFHRREELGEYFRAARAGLSERGMFVLDMYGGSEAVLELEEEREIEDGAFTYVWEQRSYHPATGRTNCFIHFRFADGSEMPEAFAYEWRLYTPAEVRDLLLECGFSSVHVYFEDFDEDGDGTGHFSRDDEGPACEGWIGYVIALP